MPKNRPTKATDPKKLEAAVYKTVHGQRQINGYQAVDPSGHLLVLAPNQELPDAAGWRWASAADVAAKKRAAAAGETEK